MSKCTDSCTVIKQRYDEDPYCLEHGTVSFSYSAGDLLEDSPNQYAQNGRVPDKVWDYLASNTMGYTIQDIADLVGCKRKAAEHQIAKAKKRKAGINQGVSVLEM